MNPIPARLGALLTVFVALSSSPTVAFARGGCADLSGRYRLEERAISPGFDPRTSWRDPEALIDVIRVAAPGDLLELSQNGCRELVIRLPESASEELARTELRLPLGGRAFRRGYRGSSWDSIEGPAVRERDRLSWSVRLSPGGDLLVRARVFRAGLDERRPVLAREALEARLVRVP
jgi:hypothetical protein